MPEKKTDSACLLNDLSDDGRKYSCEESFQVGERLLYGQANHHCRSSFQAFSRLSTKVNITRVVNGRGLTVSAVSVSVAVDPAFFALAVVARAVRALDDARRAAGCLAVAVVVTVPVAVTVAWDGNVNGLDLKQLLLSLVHCLTSVTVSVIAVAVAVMAMVSIAVSVTVTVTMTVAVAVAVSVVTVAIVSGFQHGDEIEQDEEGDQHDGLGRGGHLVLRFQQDLARLAVKASSSALRSRLPSSFIFICTLTTYCTIHKKYRHHQFA